MQNQKQLVSIIVPVYNCERYIKDCVNSLINQTYTNLEIILINDGSKDKSAEIIQNQYCGDKRIVFIDKSNEGVSAARNLGIKMAHGDYLMFVDGDDYISTDCIENALEYIQKYNLDFVLGGTQKFSGHSQKNYCIDTDDEITIGSL